MCISMLDVVLISVYYKGNHEQAMRKWLTYTTSRRTTHLTQTPRVFFADVACLWTILGRLRRGGLCSSVWAPSKYTCKTWEYFDLMLYIAPCINIIETGKVVSFETPSIIINFGRLIWCLGMCHLLYGNLSLSCSYLNYTCFVAHLLPIPDIHVLL